METRDLLLDAFGRIRDGVHRTTAGADEEALTYRPDAEANSVAWLVWHLTRVMDDHVSEIVDREQVWTSGGWSDALGLPFGPAETGYGHTSDQVAQVRVPLAQLTGYHDAVQDACVDYLGALDAGDLDRIIDDRWDPPVSVGVRLISVIGDAMQHLGQVAYVMGIYGRR